MAKAWQLKAKTATVAGREISVIQLGEAGRGRQLTSISCPADIKDGALVSAKLAETKAGGIKTKPQVLVGGRRENWLARISTDGAYIRGANGNVSYDPNQAPAKPVLVAKGYGAFGDAGRTGNWDDLIVEVADGTILRVKPTRGDAYFLFFEADKVSRLTLDELGLIGLEFDMEARIRI